jgi:hypothetical protein
MKAETRQRAGERGLLQAHIRALTLDEPPSTLESKIKALKIAARRFTTA